MKFYRHIPNALTLINAAAGLLATVELFTRHHPFYLGLFFGIALLCDVLDGALARLLRVSSNLGVQLDSLSDAISFGLFPSAIVYYLFGERYPILASVVAGICVMACVLRLGRFNLKTDHDPGFFKGLPTPAFALFCYALLLLSRMHSAGLPQWIMLFALYMAFLTNSRFYFLNFKPKKMTKQTLFPRLMVLILVALMAFWPHIYSLLFILLLYQFISSLAYRREYEIHRRN